MTNNKKRKALGVTLCAYLALCAVGGALFPTPAIAAEATQITAEEGGADDKFGLSVWISGNTAVVGAPDEGGMGAAYVFTRNAGKWTERATLVAPARVMGAKFGFNVALDGDTIIVGASNVDQQPVPGPGAAYVYVRRGDSWPLQAELEASDGRTDDAFGLDVAVSGDTVVVGAKGSNGTATLGNAYAVTPDAGAAYVFTRRGSTWTEQAKLTASDGAPNDGFGQSVGISDDTVVVGSHQSDVGAAVDQGAAYVFTGRGATWSEQAKLVAADGSALDGLGVGVSVFDDTVVATAPTDNFLQGSAYVFSRRGSSWSQEAKLTAPDGIVSDQFGRSVSGERDTVVVGAHFDEPDGAPPMDNRGSVYVFNRTAGAWSKPTKLGATGSGLLGLSVGISGDTVIGGAAFTKVGENGGQGAAYLFDLRSPAPARASVVESRRSLLRRLG